MKIGVHGHISSEQARKIAKEKLGLLSYGRDPVQEKHQLTRQPLFKQLSEEYMDKHAHHKRDRSRVEDEQMLRTYILPQLGMGRVKDIGAKDIQKLHLRLKDMLYRANRILSLHYLFVYSASAYIVSGLIAVVFSGVSFLSIANNAIFFRAKPILNVCLGALVGISGLCVFF